MSVPVFLIYHNFLLLIFANGLGLFSHELVHIFHLFTILC